MAIGDTIVVDDPRIGTRPINAAALATMINANPSAMAAAVAAVLSAAPAGAVSETPTTVAAAGATQGNAGVIPAAATVVFVTVTASTEGVILNSATPIGQKCEVWADPAIGNKVWPHVGGQIEAVATNLAQALVKAKCNIYRRITATKWRAMVGA